MDGCSPHTGRGDPRDGEVPAGAGRKPRASVGNWAETRLTIADVKVPMNCTRRWNGSKTSSWRALQAGGPMRTSTAVCAAT